MRRSELDEVGRPVGVDAAAWDAAVEELLCEIADELREPERPTAPEELAYWDLVAELELYGTGAGGGEEGDRGGGCVLPAQELSEGLQAATRGLARAGLSESESVRVLDAGITGGVEALGRLRTMADARLVLLALQVWTRGLHTEQGLSLVDWLRARCPWLPPADATAVRQVVSCITLPSGGPLKEVVLAGEAPLHRAALAARTLNRLVRCVEVDQHEGYTQILARAAAHPDLSDLDLARACAKLIRDLLDKAPERERAAQELRSVTRRSVGEGLTRFTIDAPDAAAACLDGIITSTLAAPCPTQDENGEDVPDPRSAPQRRFDALITVVNRGLSNPGAAPSTARASVLLTIPFDPETGSPAGVGLTPTGLLVGEVNAGKLACSSDVTPVWVGPGGEPLALGRTVRFATQGQFKALVVRDQHCTFLGCTRPAQWCDAHHLKWWSRGGHTDVDSMALLCEQHHTHVHQQQIHGEVVGGTVRWHT